MSIQAVAFVIEQPHPKGGMRLALISIANHADREGKNSYPGYDTIAHEMGSMSRRQAIRAVNELEAGGFVAIERGAGPGGTNRYSILGLKAKPLAVNGSLLGSGDTHDTPPERETPSAMQEMSPPMSPPRGDKMSPPKNGKEPPSPGRLPAKTEADLKAIEAKAVLDPPARSSEPREKPQAFPDWKRILEEAGKSAGSAAEVASSSPTEKGGTP